MTGERYFTQRLVASERVGDKVKQKTLLNLGRYFAIEHEDWPLLCALGKLLRNFSLENHLYLAPGVPRWERLSLCLPIW